MTDDSMWFKPKQNTPVRETLTCPKCKHLSTTHGDLSGGGCIHIERVIRKGVDGFKYYADVPCRCNFDYAHIVLNQDCLNDERR